jgi:hypothetical protein
LKENKKAARKGSLFKPFKSAKKLLRDFLFKYRLGALDRSGVAASGTTSGIRRLGINVAFARGVASGQSNGGSQEAQCREKFFHGWILMI